MVERDHDILILDGATGSELDRRGVDVSLPLWSARALIEAPDVVRAVHEDYLRAGANAITTNTFRTQQRTLDRAGCAASERAMIERAVTLAREARDAVNDAALILGSVAPLEECYQPALAPDEPTCRAEHARTIGLLVDAGVDRILIETMGTHREARAAAATARRLAPQRWMISFCMRPGAPGAVLSGEPVIDLLPDLAGASAIGFNCSPAADLAAQLRHVAPHAPGGAQLMAYANVGVADDHGSWINTDAVEPRRYAAYAAEWIEAGATIIGGCCGTTPATISAVAESSPGTAAT